MDQKAHKDRMGYKQVARMASGRVHRASGKDRKVFQAASKEPADIQVDWCSSFQSVHK